MIAVKRKIKRMLRKIEDEIVLFLAYVYVGAMK